MMRGKRYCYYVSRRLIAGSGKSDSRGWRLPAAVLEGAVARLIINALETPSAAQGLIDGASPEMLITLPSSANRFCSALSGPDRGPTLRAIVAGGRIEPGLLSITLRPEAIAERLGVPVAQISRSARCRSAASLRCAAAGSKPSSCSPTRHPLWTARW